MLHDFGKAMTEQQLKGVPDQTADATRNDFDGRLFRDPTDPTRLTDQDIFKAKINHQLSDVDFKFYQASPNEMVAIRQRIRQSDRFY